MRIAVAGASGTLGSKVVVALADAGHEPVPLSRGSGVDLLTGAGLSALLPGVGAVIDASGPVGVRARTAIDFFTHVTSVLLSAERRAGVPHHVAVSVVGAAKIDAGYYAGKAAQERALHHEPGGWSLLRTTQFHEFVPQVLRRGRLGLAYAVPTMRSQPIAAAEVAAMLVVIASGPPRAALPDLAGPREERMADLARRYRDALGPRRPIVKFPLPGAFGRGLRDGSLLPSDETLQATETFDQWLARQQAARAAGQPS